jgi:hypothetical protein
MGLSFLMAQDDDRSRLTRVSRDQRDGGVTVTLLLDAG